MPYRFANSFKMPSLWQQKFLKSVYEDVSTVESQSEKWVS